MARPIEFEGVNSVQKAPEGLEDVVQPLPTLSANYDGYPTLTSCWELSEEELAIIAKTKRVYLVVMGERMPPVMIVPEIEVK